ncbi:MAG: ABC transporter permease [Chloroflexota bacterium]
MTRHRPVVKPGFRPRWKKVLTDLWGNKVRSFLVIASIAVGLFAVGLIMNMFIINQQDMETGYRSVNPANIQVYASKFDQDLVNRVKRLEGVADAEGVRTFSLRVRASEGEWKTIDFQAFPRIDEQEINRVRLLEGTWPPDDQQVVVDSYKAGNLPAGLGGFIEVELPSGRTRLIEIAGITNDQTIGSTGSGGFFLAAIQGYITLDTAEWLGQADDLNLLYVTVEGNRDDIEHIRRVANQVADAVEGSGAVVISTATRASNDHPNRVYVDAISAVLFVLGFLVMFLSAFLITNTLAALLNQQVHQIGVMKTVGARRGQIIGIYMVQIFVFGVVAFFVALPLSSRASYWLLELFSSAINTQLQGFRVIPLVIWAQLVIALIVPQAAGIVPIVQGTRVSAVEAMSGYSQAHPPNPRDWVNRTLHRIRRLPRPTMLSLRNTFRRKGRLFLTLLTLTLGGAIFIGTFNVQRSLTNYVASIGRYFAADVNLTLKIPYRITEIDQLLMEVPGVSRVEAWSAAAGELVMPDGSSGETVRLLAPPAGSPLVKANLLEGRWLIPGDEGAIAVNERFREMFPDLRVGDTLRLKILGKEDDWIVVGFFQLTGKSGGYVAYSTYESLSGVIHQKNRSNIYRITADRAGLTLEEQKALGRAIQDALEANGYQVAEVEAGESLTETTSSGLNILTAFLMIMALLIALVGSIGLAGTMSMNVLERTREIGIIRAIGASDRAVIDLVMVEGVLIGLMSWVFGTLLSLPISSLMSNAINMALFGVPAEFTFTPLGVILWLMIVLVLSALASVGPARNASRLTIREVLAYE